MQPEPMLQKAERFIQSAELLANEGDFDSAASRLYYAMYFIAETLLAAKDLTFSSHRGLISAFGQHFAKTGEMDYRFHQALIAAFGQRQLGDYSVQSGLCREDIDAMLVDAREFLAVANQWLSNHT
jgi:uncharacterized protein (UPF0332 family)